MLLDKTQATDTMLSENDVNINYWLKGEHDEWYECRIEVFDKHGKVYIDKTVLVLKDDTSYKYICDMRFADYVAKNVKSGTRFRLAPPQLSFTIEEI
jgi:hypothetical protein